LREWDFKSTAFYARNNIRKLKLGAISVYVRKVWINAGFGFDCGGIFLFKRILFGG